LDWMLAARRRKRVELKGTPGQRVFALPLSQAPSHNTTPRTSACSSHISGRSEGHTAIGAKAKISERTNNVTTVHALLKPKLGERR
jgi:hypothetical protein